jgi:catechol 2,3-dioxygenase-like lactoylglutathione lyase family enzyme
MLDHVTIRVSDREASGRFYNTVLGPLGRARDHAGAIHDEWDDFTLAEAGPEPLTENLHVAFAAASRAEVDAFWKAGVDAGYRSDGAPGLRPVYHDDYYGGFLLDPDGNSVEAVFHGEPRRPGGAIDHLWLRVADLEASEQFWEAVAPVLGVGVRRSTRAERVHVEKGDRSFALLPGDPPTRNVHLAFPAPDEATVQGFHRVALAAGYRDNGAPGPRPQYRGSYYGAFVLDADGNNVEAVYHGAVPLDADRHKP